MKRRAALLLLACMTTGAAPSPTSEFESPYEVRVLPGGTVVEVSGSFSWALPQNFQAILAQAPNARTVRLESPGGHVKPALEVAALVGTMRVNGQGAALAGLGTEAGHQVFCPALLGLLQMALALGDATRGRTLRALLSSG